MGLSSSLDMASSSWFRPLQPAPPVPNPASTTRYACLVHLAVWFAHICQLLLLNPAPSATFKTLLPAGVRPQHTRQCAWRQQRHRPPAAEAAGDVGRQRVCAAAAGCAVWGAAGGAAEGSAVCGNWQWRVSLRLLEGMWGVGWIPVPEVLPAWAWAECLGGTRV
jgi:hypothetical protein